MLRQGCKPHGHCVSGSPAGRNFPCEVLLLRQSPGTGDGGASRAGTALEQLLLRSHSPAASILPRAKAENQLRCLGCPSTPGLSGLTQQVAPILQGNTGSPGSLSSAEPPILRTYSPFPPQLGLCVRVPCFASMPGSSWLSLHNTP